MGPPTDPPPLPPPPSRPGFTGTPGPTPSLPPSPAPLTPPAAAIPAGSGSGVGPLARSPGGLRVGRYLVSGELGRGGMGVVYRAHDPALRRDVAIKMIVDASQVTPKRVARFEREATSAARLRHPGIVAVHEVGVHEGKPFIVMDLIEGESLEAWLVARARGPREVARIVRDVARALHHAHEHGVLHRDVKPDNVLIDRDGDARLTDFGLARDLDDERALTLSGQTIGTPQYMAPEQTASGRGGQGPPTDVWGLGAVLYRALTGRPPFWGAGSLVELARRVVTEDPAAPRSIAPRVPADLETIALHCLEKAPAARYPTAAALADDLERYLAGEPIEARPLGQIGRARRWTRRHRALAAAVTVAVTGLVALVVVGTIASLRARTALVAQARREARERLDAFEAALGPGASDRADDVVLVAGLDALEATGRLLTLAPDDEPARTARFEAAMRLGEVARARRQWGLAASAYHKAAGLGVDDARAAAAAEAVAAERDAFESERRAAIDEVLAQARSGALRARGTEAIERALFTLVGNRGPATAARLAEALDEVTATLRAARRDLLLSARDHRPPKHPADCLDGLEAALERPRVPGEKPDERTEELLEHARGHVTLAEKERRPDQRDASWEDVLAAAQEGRVGEDGFLLARLCCEALGWMQRRDEELIGALCRHLDACASGVRAIPPGIALSVLGGEEAHRMILFEAERRGFGGLFFQRVSRYLERDGAPAPDEQDMEAALDDELHRALARESLGDLPGALAIYDAAVARRPTWVRALANRGSLRLQMGDVEGALRDMDRAIELQPQRGGIWSNRARARLAAGDPEGALADAREGVKLAPDEWRTHSVLGRVLDHLERWDEALRALDRAVELGPGQADPLVERARVHRHRGDLAAALADADRAVAVDPESAGAHYERGYIHKLAGRPREALADYDRAIELRPRLAEAWRRRASVRRELHDPRGAVEDNTRVLELAPDDAIAWGNRGNAHYDLGDYERALADWERALELDPEQVWVWQSRASAFIARGDFARAIPDLDQALAREPDRPSALFARGAARAKTGDARGAIADLERLLELEPDHEQAEGIRTTIANLRRRLGR